MDNAIVVYVEKVESSATDFGRTIEQEVQENGSLSDDRLEELVRNSKLMQDVEDAIQENAQRELDEYIGQKEDDATAAAIDRIISDRRADLSESAVLYQPSSSRSAAGAVDRRRVVKRRRISLNQADRLADGTNGKVVKPTTSIDEADDDDIITYDEDSDFWDNYLPSLYIPQSLPMSELLGGSEQELIKYLRNHATSIQDICKIIQQTRKLGVLGCEYFLGGMTDVCNLIVENNIPHRASTRKRKLETLDE